MSPSSHARVNSLLARSRSGLGPADTRSLPVTTHRRASPTSHVGPSAGFDAEVELAADGLAAGCEQAASAAAMLADRASLEKDTIRS
jgi:hypothetical protein